VGAAIRFVREKGVRGADGDSEMHLERDFGVRARSVAVHGDLECDAVLGKESDGEFPRR
jgi:hypothetical protein